MVSRELRGTGKVRFKVDLKYWPCRESYEQEREPIRKEYTYQYHEEAMDKFHELERMWENHELGWNASVYVTEEILITDNIAYFG